MPVLVLNAALQPLSVITERRLISLYIKEKIAFLNEDSRQTVEQAILARQIELKRPMIVRLYANIHPPFIHPKATRSNIFLRDNYTCQYCGKKEKELTLDHIIPRSKGGVTSWDNIVTSCKSCNGKKGNNSLQEARMQLLFPQRKRALHHWYFLLRYPQLYQAYNDLLHSSYEYKYAN